MPSEPWLDLFAKYASKTGFQLVPIPSLEGAPLLSTSARLWRAPYAQMLVLPIVQVAEHELRLSARIGQEWLDLASMAVEREDHKVMDAYLVLVLGENVPRQMLGAVRDIELDPTACRKHVVWPLPGNEADIVWRRFLRVTPVGLPYSPTAAGMTNTPVLASEFEQSLLDSVKNLQGRAAASLHAQRPAGSGS